MVTPASIMAGSDPVALWLRLDLLTRRVVGKRMEEGTTPETDEALDKLMWLRVTEWLHKAVQS